MSRIGTDESKTRLANERAELIGKYRHVFLSSPMGHEVLADILQSARFLQLQRPGDPLDAAGQNFGIIILQRCGILTKGASMREIVDALAQILPKTQEETT